MSRDGPPFPPGAGARKPDAPKTPLNKRAYTLNLTFPALLTTAIVGVIAVCWVFMLGVMVGRGYNPDAKLNELSERVLRNRQTPVVQEPPQAILRPEELNFGAALRDRPIRNSATDAEMPVAEMPVSQENSTVADGVTGNAPAVHTPPPAPPASQDVLPTRFDFIYQAAAFRDAGQADRLRERLEGEGVRTVLETSPGRDGRNWYKVLAVRRGTEEDSKQLVAVLESLRLGQPMVRSKKPVPVGTGAR